MINKILGQTAFWVVNKAIAKILKCNDSALLLSDLVDKFQYFKSENSLIDGFFFYTSEKIEENLNISYKKQKKCIELLKKYELIETKLIGVPAKLHFTVRYNKILQMLQTSIAQMEKLELPKSKNIIKDNNNRNIIIDELKKENAHTFFLTDDIAETYETQKSTETAQISTIIPEEVQSYQNNKIIKYKLPYNEINEQITVGHIIRKIKDEYPIDWDTFKISCSIKEDSSMLNSAMKNWWEDRVVVRDWCNKQDVPFRDWDAIYKDIKNFVRNFAKLYYK